MREDMDPTYQWAGCQKICGHVLVTHIWEWWHQKVNLGCMMAESIQLVIGFHTIQATRKEGRVFTEAVDVGMERGQKGC